VEDHEELDHPNESLKSSAEEEEFDDDHHQWTSTLLTEDKESKHSARLKAPEVVMDEALERYIVEMRKKGLLDEDLDHVDVGQDEELTDTGVKRDEEGNADDKVGSGRSSRAVRPLPLYRTSPH
jgi:hypothetical protein